MRSKGRLVDLMVYSQDTPDVSIILDFEDVLVDWDTLISTQLGARLSRLNEYERDAVVSQLKLPQHSSFIKKMPCWVSVKLLRNWLQSLKTLLREYSVMTLRVSICLGGGRGSSWAYQQKQQWVSQHLGPTALVHAVCGRNRFVF